MIYKYGVYVDDMYSCGVQGPDHAQVITETLHYVWLCAEDGVITIKGARGKKFTPLELMTLLEKIP